MGFQLNRNNDYSTGSGIENLRASIYRRLYTDPGSFKVHPLYGCGVKSFLKKQMNFVNVGQLKKAIIANLLRDVRISKVDVTIIIQNFSGVPGLQIIVSPTVSGQVLKLVPFDFQRA
jgi:phage baseplate assembly protein W